MSRTAKAFFWSYVFLLFLRKVSTAHPDMICRKSLPLPLGMVHTYPEICENANFFYEYGLRPHVSSVFSGHIRKFLKTLSRVEIFLSDTNTYTCGRSYPEIFEYAFVILLDPVFTASIINKHGVQQGCSFFVSCSDF